jgi:phosphoribulokinase
MSLNDGGVRLGLGLAAVGCLLILSGDRSTQYYAPVTPAMQQSLRGAPMAVNAQVPAMVYDAASATYVPVYTAPPASSSGPSLTTCCVVAFCAAALATSPVALAAVQGAGTVVIGLAADSGCGKSTFMRRMTSIFGGEPKAPEGGNPESNTLLSDKTTVLCLDDYHCLDRFGRKEKNVTALAPEAQNFDLMYEQVKALKEGKPVEKPIYNHVSGLLDPPEKIEAPEILIIEGLHPFFDKRVQDLLDFKIYLDISDEVKFAWKIQRDMKERGWTLEQVKESIEGRKADFAAYVDPQKKDADIVIEVLPTWEPSDEINLDAGDKPLRVRMIQKNGSKLFNPAFIFDKGASVEWVPDGKKLTAASPGLKFASYSEDYYGQDVTVVEMVGDLAKLDDVSYVEKQMTDAATKFDGEMAEQMLKNSSFPGSANGTGLFQTVVGLKIREVYEAVSGKEMAPVK